MAQTISPYCRKLRYFTEVPQSLANPCKTPLVNKPPPLHPCDFLRLKFYSNLSIFKAFLPKKVKNPKNFACGASLKLYFRLRFKKTSKSFKENFKKIFEKFWKNLAHFYLLTFQFCFEAQKGTKVDKNGLFLKIFLQFVRNILEILTSVFELGKTSVWPYGGFRKVSGRNFDSMHIRLPYTQS